MAVVRMLPGLGDLLCAVPALRGLRATLPGADVTFVGRRSGCWLADRYPELIDEWLGCDWCAGLVESEDDLQALEVVLDTARSRRFDLAIQMHGDGRVTNGFTAALGATHWSWAGPMADDVHEIERCVAAVAAAGLAIEPGPMSMAVGDDDVAPTGVPDGPYAVVHAGASRPQRRWPVVAFAEVTGALLDRLPCVVLTGSGSEVPIVRRVRWAIGPSLERRVVDIAGATSLGSLAATLASARVVVANDTGVAHLAAAVGAPTVTVFGHPDRVRWEPPGARGVGGRGGWPPVDAVIAAIDAIPEITTC